METSKSMPRLLRYFDVFHKINRVFEELPAYDMETFSFRQDYQNHMVVVFHWGGHLTVPESSSEGIDAWIADERQVARSMVENLIVNTDRGIDWWGLYTGEYGGFLQTGVNVHLEMKMIMPVFLNIWNKVPLGDYLKFLPEEFVRNFLPGMRVYFTDSRFLGYTVCLKTGTREVRCVPQTA